MGQNAQTVKPPRGFVTIDWMVLAVAGIALLFLLGTMIRTSVEPVNTAGFGGLQAIGSDETLLAFQDFSFEATGWSPAETSDALPGLGPVLGPFTDEAVQRSFAMPADADTANISFDLHLIGDWLGQGEFHVALGDADVLTIRLPGPENATAEMVELRAVEAPGLQVFADQQFVSPRAPEAALPGATDDFVTYSIQLRVTNPGETLALRLASDGEGEARWTLDNLTVVATSGDGLSGA